MEEFILILVRFRFGFLSRYFLDRFGVLEGIVSKVFIIWVCFLFIVFCDIFFKWFCKEDIKKILLWFFCKFFSIRIIIDCIEIFL